MESIRFKLWTTIIALIFIILTPIMYMQVVRLEKTYTSIKIHDAMEATSEIVNIYKNKGVNESSDEVSALAGEDEVCVSLYDEKGNPVVDYKMNAIGCVFEQLDDKDKSNVLSYIASLKSELVTFELDSNSNYPAALYGSYVTTNDNNNYLMVVSTYVTPVGRILDLLRTQLLMLTIPLLLAGTIIAFFISRGFSKPIMELSKATTEMAKGKYETRVDVNRDDEIGVLQQNFNYMGEQIDQLDELRRDLIANVSHDLKTPLTMIRGYAETIRDLTGDMPEKRNEQLGIIIEESDRLNALVNDLLNLSRFQSGQITLEPKVFDLNDMIEQTLKQYDFLITNKGYTFVYEDQGPCYVYGDVLRMKQVVYNILNNAVNHTGEDKYVYINLIKKTEKYRVEIKDTGLGIKKEDLNRIWDRYYKIDNSGKRRVAGTGIGLAIVKEILSAHEVLFGVDSEYGHGATFYWEMNKVEHFVKSDVEQVEAIEEKVDKREENV